MSDTRLRVTVTAVGSPCHGPTVDLNGRAKDVEITSTYPINRAHGIESAARGIGAAGPDVSEPSDS